MDGVLGYVLALFLLLSIGNLAPLVFPVGARHQRVCTACESTPSGVVNDVSNGIPT